MNPLEQQKVEPWVDLQLRNLTQTGSKGSHLKSEKGRLYFCVGHNEQKSITDVNPLKAFILLGDLGSLGLH